MDYSPLYQLLDRTRNHLAPLGIGLQFLRFFAWSSLGWGVALLGARLFGMAFGTIFIWEAGAFLGGCAGWIDGWRRRPDENGIARWLDRELHTGAAFAAALICLDRDCSGLVDPLVVQRATGMAAQPAASIEAELRRSWRRARTPLLHWAGFTLTVQLLILAGLILTPPSWNSHFRPQTAPGGRPPVRQRHAVTQKAIPGPVVSARMIARQLFPENPQVAAALESALQSGDMEKVERFLGRAKTEVRPLDKEDAALQRRLFNAARDYPNQQPPMGEAPDSRTVARQAAGEDSGRRRPQQTADGNQEAREARSSGAHPGSPDAARQDSAHLHLAEGSRPREADAAPGSQNGFLPQGGNQAGHQSGAERGDWGIILPGQAGRKFLIRQNEDKLEFILPGKEAQLPAHQVLPAFREAAEAALQRKSVPGEYQDIVRGYFQELTRQK